MTEVRVGLRRLGVVEALEEFGEGMGERVFVTETESRDPPVAGVRVIAVGSMDAGPTAAVTRDGVVEVVQAVEVMEIPLQRLLLAVDFERVEGLVAACVAGRLELGERTVFEAAQEDARIIDGDGVDLAGGGMDAFFNEGLGHCRYFGDLTVDPSGRVDAMREQVARHAGTSGRGVEAPEACTALRQLGRDCPILEEVSAVVKDATQFASSDDVLRERDGRKEAVVIPDEIREARLFHGGDHLLALLAVERQGLFAEDYLTVLDALQGNLGVRVIGGADINSVDVGAGDELAPVGFVGGVAPLLGEVFHLGFIAAADGLADDVVAGGELVLRKEVTDL